uniref:WGS project CAEQ00000000 data, annotated contig 184 n=1 Tax=Trypanosoma congolense (strain IL3000) TaxID=1068625 RepID=F9W9A4_TRYCI|nr:unnamed protein product [Trypanosoma congolense IL3000]
MRDQRNYGVKTILYISVWRFCCVLLAVVRGLAIFFFCTTKPMENSEGFLWPVSPSLTVHHCRRNILVAATHCHLSSQKALALLCRSYRHALGGYYGVEGYAPFETLTATVLSYVLQFSFGCFCPFFLTIFYFRLRYFCSMLFFSFTFKSKKKKTVRCSSCGVVWVGRRATFGQAQVGLVEVS